MVIDSGSDPQSKMSKAKKNSTKEKASKTDYKYVLTVFLSFG